MSIDSEVRRSPTYICNGITSTFAFAFKVFTQADIKVVLLDTTNVETELTLGTHYSVSLNPDQDMSPGGSITTLSTYATGNYITVSSQLANLQPTKLTNQGGFYPDTINDALDRSTIQIQQLAETLSRAATLPISGIGSIDPATLFFGVNPAGTAAELKAMVDLAGAPVSLFMLSLLALTNADSARTALAAAKLGINTDITQLGSIISINGGQLAGLRNKIINGAMLVDQRNNGAAQTLTAGAALAYTVDTFFAYCTGANLTGQQVAGPTANSKRYKFTGAAGVTAAGFGTRIEAADTAMLASSSVTFSAKLSSSSLTSITWTAYYANTTDTFGTLASPTKTQIATGVFNINSTEADYSAIINLPAAATTGIEIVLTAGALLAGQTLTIGNIQLESGEVATSFEYLPISLLHKLCLWRYETGNYNYRFSMGGACGWSAPITLSKKRVSPTFVATNTVFTGQVSGFSYGAISNTHAFLSASVAGIGDSNVSGSWTASAEL